MGTLESLKSMFFLVILERPQNYKSLMNFTVSIRLVFILFASACMRGQIDVNEISFQKVLGEISESSITEILEDRNGFLWIGTTNGILKYDGSSFQNFDAYYNESRVNNFVKEIYEGDSGILYVGTYNGLNFYDETLGVLKRYPFKGESEFINKTDINALLETKNYLWVGTTKNGLFRYNLNTGKVRRLFFNTKDFDYGNVLYISKYGNNHYVVINRNAAYVINHDMAIISSVKLSNIKSVKRVSSNQFLLGSFDGFFSELKIGVNFKINKQNSRKITDYRISALEEDASGNIWLASENGGVFILSRESKAMFHLQNTSEDPDVLPNNSIWSIYKASNGVMWLGSFKRGLCFYDKEYLKFKHEKKNKPIKSSLSNNIATCFLEDKNKNIWIGTDGGGLNYWDRNKKTYTHYSLDNGKLNTNVVLSIVRKDNELWIASWADGITIFDMDSKEYRVMNVENSSLSSKFLENLLKDNHGNIWIATFRGGLHKYNSITDRLEKIHLVMDGRVLNPTQVITVFEDNLGDIWLGSHGDGVIRLKNENDIWKVANQYKVRSEEEISISSDFVNVIHQDQNGLLWVGTDSGLNKYSTKSNLFIRIEEPEELKNISIESIEHDEKGSLWLGTNKGLKKYNPFDNELISYNTSDGVQGANFNSSSSYKLSSKELVFGGSNGFNVFYPNKIKKRKDKPQLYISKLKIQNKQVYPNDEFGVLKKTISKTDTLSLDYTHNVINFEFTTVTYRNPEKVSYAYFLEGFEDDWNYVGNKNDVTYTNLDPGKYKLHVKSTNSDGLWVGNEKTLCLEVIPPFWQALWFKVLTIGLLLVVGYLIYYSRTRSVIRNQKKLKKEIALRTKELQLQKDKLMDVADELSFKNEEIQRFAFSVSHDLKSPLSNIRTITELIQMEFSEKDLPLIEKYMEMIDVSCETMTDLIADITRVARIGKIKNNKEMLDTNRMVKLSRVMINTKFEEQNVALIIKESLPKIYADRNRIIQVFSNLFDNSIKYMGNQKNPIIEIKFEENNETVTLFVSDNGSGMDNKSLKKLFSPFERFHSGTNGSGLGLYMIKQIINSHGGTISATSEGKGKGATFIVTLPK